MQALREGGCQWANTVPDLFLAVPSLLVNLFLHESQINDYFEAQVVGKHLRKVSSCIGSKLFY